MVLFLCIRQWRYSQIAIHFLLMLIRHDHPLPIEAVRMHTHNLVHDALKVRKVRMVWLDPAKTLAGQGFSVAFSNT